tara:strand:+ start:471417 stop:473336 length:1920 start_codon:yes stop_codon:yes gene_type:complete
LTDKDNTQQNLRERQRDQEIFKNATAAALKALSGGEDVSVSFSAHEAVSARLPFSDLHKSAKLPTIADAQNAGQRTDLRAASDIRALHLAHHNVTLHKSRLPNNTQSAAMWDALERARCEAAGMRRMKGVAKNLNEALRAECQIKHYDRMDSKDPCPYAEALYILSRAALSGTDLPDTAQKIQHYWGKELSDKLGNTSFADLIPYIEDQDRFATKAVRLLNQLGLEGFEDLLEQDAGSKGSEENDNGDQSAAQEDDKDTDQEEKSEDALPDDPLKGEQAQDVSDDSELHDTDKQDEENHASEDVNDNGEDNDNSASSEEAQGQSTPLMQNGHSANYRIYTSEFDETISADELATPEDLKRLRDTLDSYLERYQSMITRLANRLQRKLMAQQQRSWKFDLEEGHIDSSRLARIIANPSVPLSFKQEQETEFKDTILTLLLDNSGSMRGRPITISALCADILIRTLERCGIKCEVLGFTTRAWKGGKSRDLWIDNGRPANPGRLNDIRHIIYKEADTPWRRSKNNLGLMLKEGLLKENIDGEALAWAYNRLARRHEERKILMVISDGAPVDDSTLSNNPATFLEKDLQAVIYRIENNSNIELSAIGIGHDVTQYYENSITITDVEQLAEALMTKLESLFEK